MMSFIRNINVWADSRKGYWWRVLIILWFLYLLMQHMSNDAYAMDRATNIISAFDLGMHELGHILFIPFGEFMTILGGSLFQCLFPLLWVGALTVKRWYFGAAMCLCWFAFNLYDVSAYAADATARLLPLATFSSNYDDAHDWYQILSRLDALHMDMQIAANLRVAGAIAAVLGLLVGTYLVIRMMRMALRNNPDDI